MCGIYFSYSEEGYLPPSDGVLGCLNRRGPDHSQVVQRKLERSNHADSISNKASYLTFVSTVLSLRGEHVIQQPLQDAASGSLLCWNGEAWKVHSTFLDGNDVQPIFTLLLEATGYDIVENSDKSIAYCETLQAVTNVIASISGPYCFVFYDARHRQIFYGRDVLGRRSLLSTTSENGSLTVSSICNGAVSDAWTEVEANGIYVLDLKTGRASTADSRQAIKHIRWLKEDDIPETTPFLVRSPRPFARLLY